jgi:hypothetical protein
MNWGKGITISITVFVVATLSVVSYLISLDFYLVNQDHYEQGVHYQDVIDSKDRVQKLPEQVVILFDESRTALKIVFPDSVHNYAENGLMRLNRPNNPEIDKEVSILFEAGSTHIIPTEGLEKGKWNLDLSWELNGEEYLIEKDIIL